MWCLIVQAILLLRTIQIYELALSLERLSTGIMRSVHSPRHHWPLCASLSRFLTCLIHITMVVARGAEYGSGNFSVYDAGQFAKQAEMLSIISRISLVALLLSNGCYSGLVPE